MNQEINAAAEWWAQRLREMPSHSSGDQLIDAAASFIAMTTTGPLSEEKVQAFKDALIAALKQDLAENEHIFPFGCDYSPDQILNDAANIAKINQVHSRLPIKTIMWVEPGSVSVAHGHGSSTVVIYSAQED